MEPIISPWVFYLVHVCNAINIFSTVMVVIGVIALIVLLLAPVDDLGIHKGEIIKKTSIALTCFLLLAIFVPSESVLTKMVIANYITHDNITVVQSNTIEFIDKVVATIRQK